MMPTPELTVRDDHLRTTSQTMVQCRDDDLVVTYIDRDCNSGECTARRGLTWTYGDAILPAAIAEDRLVGGVRVREFPWRGKTHAAGDRLGVACPDPHPSPALGGTLCPRAPTARNECVLAEESTASLPPVLGLPWLDLAWCRSVATPERWCRGLRLPRRQAFDGPPRAEGSAGRHGIRADAQGAAGGRPMTPDVPTSCAWTTTSSATPLTIDGRRMRRMWTAAAPTVTERT
jgi:hypothetical protein